MGIFDIFGSQPTTPPAPAATPATNPGNLSQNPTPATPGNAAVPDTPVNESPMDQFSDLWQPSENTGTPEPLINIDPKQLADAAKKTDFSKIISPELRQQVEQGGEAGTIAMMQAMNQMAQAVYAQSAFANSKIIEQAVSKARDQFNSDIPAHVKKMQVSDTLRTENPVFNHPSASPLLSAIEAQITTKYPNASANEITTMAKKYIENFADAVKAPQNAADAAAKAKDSTDMNWSEYFSK